MSTALFVTQPAHEPTGQGSARPLNGQRERAVGYEGHPGLCNLCLPVPLFTGHNRCQPWLQDSRGPFTESGKSTRTRRTADASSSVTAQLHAESELESGTSGPFHPTARGPSDTLGDVLQDDLLDSPKKSLLRRLTLQGPPAEGRQWQRTPMCMRTTLGHRQRRTPVVAVSC